MSTMHKLFLAIALPALLLLAGCRQKETQAVIHTCFGDIQIRLYNSTPLHRDNFVRLARSGFYDSLLFHRVIRDFVIQGGDPDSKHAPAGDLLGGGGPDHQIPAEIGAPHIRGAVAAARLADSRNPERMSNGSQFFIVLGGPQTDESLDHWEKRVGVPYRPEWRARYKEKGGAPQLDGQYTVFGEVISGWEVLDKIAAVPRDANDRPLEDIRMRVTVEE